MVHEFFLAKALLRGPSCSMGSFMAFRTFAAGYGSAPAEVFLPLAHASNSLRYVGKGARAHHFPLRHLNIEPQQLAFVALAQQAAWQRQGQILLQQGVPSHHERPLLGQYLLAASRQMIRFHALARLLGIPDDMLPSMDEVSEIAQRCDAQVNQLNLEHPLEASAPCAAGDGLTPSGPQRP